MKPETAAWIDLAIMYQSHRGKLPRQGDYEFTWWSGLCDWLLVGRYHTSKRQRKVWQKMYVRAVKHAPLLGHGHVYWWETGRWAPRVKFCLKMAELAETER